MGKGEKEGCRVAVVHNVGLLNFLKLNSLHCERRPLNLLKAVVHNDSHYHLLHKHTSFDIILKL